MDRADLVDRYTEAAARALEAFPIEPDDVRPIWISENVTFRITDRSSGAPYVLRLHRPGYHGLPALNSERVWTRALDEAGVATQSGLRTRSGDHFHLVDIPETGEQRFAGMTEWVEGVLLGDRLGESSDLDEVTGSYLQIGEIAAAIHNQSSGWTPPPGFERHSLDVDGFLGDAPFWGRFWEHPGLRPDERQLLLETRARFREVLEDYGRDWEIFSMIHADLHAGNVLVRDGAVTVIDFDDSGYGWHTYELAVALFMEQAKPHFSEMRAALLDGYRKHRPLADRDEALLPLFLLIRGMALIGWIHQRPELDLVEFFDGLRKAVCAACESFEPPL